MSKINSNKDFSYPKPEDPDLLTKIFKKREYYYYKVPHREEMKDYEEVQNYRAANCKMGTDMEPREQQNIIPNFISPNTPYKGVILMHGVGSGKTMTAIRVAEQFKDQVKKYNTKIYVVVPGPNTRENFKKELVMTTGETYLKNKELLNQMSKADVERERKQAIYSALQFYKILSYKTFYKKVLGEKIVEKKLIGENKIKSSYRKNDEGEIEREIVVDKITNMNNSILIIDEAHNISGNEYGDALKKIIKNSENLRVILLTATPMINLADEIVDLLNFIRPLNDQVMRDRIFTTEKNYEMKIKSDGLEYLKEKAQGYISFYRGSIPYTFAKRIEKGVIPNGMLFTPVIKCYMSDFQYKTYLLASEKIEDTLDRGASSASNFVFPGLNKEKNDLFGYYSTEGVNTILAQLAVDGSKLRQLINKKLFNGKLSKSDEDNFILENEKKNLTGTMLKMPYVKYFSIKFYKLILRLSKLVSNRKGSATAFIYSNLVKAGGMELFAEALLQNGYLEYQEDSKNYDIQDETIDYKTGYTYLEYKKNKNLNISEFKPATFILVTGSSDESGEDLPEIKQKQIQDVFNNYDNIDGKHIKFVLGSRVMNEGVTLKNCKEVHIIDTFYNIPKAEQVIGRAIRMCVHQESISDKYKFPKVYVYRYVVALSSGSKKTDKKNKDLSVDELLYQKAELKYLTVKEVERALKEVAIDCPLLLHANMFPEEIEKYKNCVYPTIENVKAGKQICPALCDFRNCTLKCSSTTLNDKYWDTKNKLYKDLDKDQINYNTFNDDLAKYEITLIKNRIKDLFRFKHVYLYSEIIEEIKRSFLQHQSELFEEYFLDQAIEDMMPKSENDFNNYKDTLYDKYNRPGYLIQRDKYFIFQPFNEDEDVPMYYRQQTTIKQQNQVSLNNFIKQNHDNLNIEEDTNIDDETKKVEKSYDFDSTLDYYNDREENFIVGIIDKNLNKLASNEDDLFKIRPGKSQDSNKDKEKEKKRGTGIHTFKGAVCTTSKDKGYLMSLVKKIPDISKEEITRIDKLTRENICNEIKDKLLYLEKYSTSKDNNKMTYMMIPYDHPTYLFPYNLEDRLKYKIDRFNKIVERKINHVVTSSKNKDKYELTFKNDKFMDEKSKIRAIEKEGFILKSNVWTLVIE
jgi:hypothetical protein